MHIFKILLVLRLASLLAPVACHGQQLQAFFLYSKLDKLTQMQINWLISQGKCQPRGVNGQSPGWWSHTVS